MNARFWSKVDQSPGLFECWPWMGTIDRKGYGEFPVGHSKKFRAHRVAYEALVGPIPTGLQLDHICRTRNCVNPAHLEPVTNRENVLRGVGPIAEHARATHCVRGHPLSGSNLQIYRRKHGLPGRHCAECHRGYERARRLRRDAA